MGNAVSRQLQKSWPKHYGKERAVATEMHRRAFPDLREAVSNLSPKPWGWNSQEQREGTLQRRNRTKAQHCEVASFCPLTPPPTTFINYFPVWITVGLCLQHTLSPGVTGCLPNFSLCPTQLPVKTRKEARVHPLRSCRFSFICHKLAIWHGPEYCHEHLLDFSLPNSLLIHS